MRCVFRLASQPTPTVTPNMIILIRTILIGLQDEIAPIEVKVKKAKVAMEADEHPKPKTTIEGLAKLPAVFKKVFTKLVVIPALESESEYNEYDFRHYYTPAPIPIRAHLLWNHWCRFHEWCRLYRLCEIGMNDVLKASFYPDSLLDIIEI